MTAQVGSAQKVYWTLSRAGRETVAAVDQRSFTFTAGPVVGDESVTLKVTAINQRKLLYGENGLGA